MTEQEERPASRSSWLIEMIRGWFVFNPYRKKIRQLDDLSDAIERDPAEAIHYLLRAGVHVDLFQFQRAADDYERALELAENALAEADWGLSAQVIRDKALRGLRQIQRHLE